MRGLTRKRIYIKFIRMGILEYEDIFLPCSQTLKLGNVLFIHGFTGTYHDYFSAAALEPYFDYYAINLPGHGSKKIECFDSDLESYVSYIVEYIKYKNLYGLTLIGHSLGGALAALIENQIRERISNLIVINPLARSILTVPDLENVLFPKTLDAVFELCRYAYHNFENMKDVSGFKEACQKSLEFQLEREQYFRGLFKLLASGKTIESIERAFSSVKVRSLYVMGRHDRIVPIDGAAERISKNIHISQCIFENSGHCPHNEEPEDFFKCIYTFIRAAL